MRSPREILFRLGQETANTWLYLRRPHVQIPVEAPLRGLPTPRDAAAAARGTPYAAELVRTAESVLDHRFPLLGFTVETGPDIDWARDYSSGVAAQRRYFRFVPYLDPRRAGDHKLIWELNRHQHWVLLAQAYLLSGRREFLAEIEGQFEGWMRQNPFLEGINWTSALEVAFRALSWTWVTHLAGEFLDAKLLPRLAGELYRHGLYLESNLSVYFSPNTHLLGEAVALHALGTLFPSFPRAAAWTETGARITREQMEAQVRDDGSHFEQSSYYHVYALDMFLFHAVLSRTTPRYRDGLARMAGYLSSFLGPARRLPFVGDDDGGRFFHPFGDRETFGRATLATAGALLERCDWPFDAVDAFEQALWWLGPPAIRTAPPADFKSKFHPACGVAVMAAEDVHVVADAGPFGPGSAGHSHSDTLSVVVRAGAEDILIDPGTYTYVGDPVWRDRFRGSAMHNTLRIDGVDQASPAGPFRWADKPAITVEDWASTPDRDDLRASCSYRGFTHRRWIVFLKPDIILIADEVNGPPGEHDIEQFWHPGAAVQATAPGVFRIGSRAFLCFAAGDAVLEEAGDFGWRSRVFGEKIAVPFLRLARKTTLAARFATLLDLSGTGGASRIIILPDPEKAFELQVSGVKSFVVRLARTGNLCAR